MMQIYHIVTNTRASRLAALWLVLLISTPAAAQDAVYLFPYFRGNGETGVYLAASDDGLVFRDLNGGEPIFSPPDWPDENLTRDPSIAIGPDGTFHMVWTTHWWSKSIGHASSRDLRTWSEPQRIQVWPEDAGVANSWAPEIMFDDAAKHFQIVWAATHRDRISGQGTSETGQPGDDRRLEHRLYAMTTADFKTFSDTKLFYDGGFSVIDGMIVRDAANDRYVMVIKNETRYPTAQKNLHLLFSKSASGPFEGLVGPIAGPGAKLRTEWVEGPTLLKIGDLWHLYFDSYGARPGHLSVMTSPDLVEWTDKTGEARLPRRGRHGTVFAAPREKVAWLNE